MLQAWHRLPHFDMPREGQSAYADSAAPENFTVDVCYADRPGLGPCLAVALATWGDSLGSDVLIGRLRQPLGTAQPPAQWQHSIVGRTWPEYAGSPRTDAGEYQLLQQYIPVPCRENVFHWRGMTACHAMHAASPCACQTTLPCAAHEHMQC